jgi:sodium/pantothenate symporter
MNASQLSLPAITTFIQQLPSDLSGHFLTLAQAAANTPAAAAATSNSPPSVGLGAMFMLILFILGSIWIGVIANRSTEQGAGFMKGFFLGNRGLGAWALALTATIQSGGTFMGFPSLVYSHGWIVALWIGSYMVVPITGFGILGKRLAQLSRRTGAITVPDLFRTRFNSPALGLLCTTFILLYLSFMMFAQFKAGAIVLQLAWPSGGELSLSEDAVSVSMFRYRVGLLIFAVTVVGYTVMGGFLAAVWTDLFQSLLMFVGVMILLCASLYAVGGLENATRQSMENTGPGFVFGPGYMFDGSQNEFLPLSLAISFFIVWVWGGVGAPAGLVRLMASQNTSVIRRSIYLLSLYNMGIYLPLIIICVCGRALIPALDITKQTDQIIPRLAILTTKDLPGGSLIAGLILAAPFGAVMATVSSYLVVLSSGLVRDIYQRLINPHADRDHLRRAAWIAMIGAGIVSVLVSWKPIDYLQVFIVFSTSGAAATFLFPALMACYWRRATTTGVVAAMVSGALTVLTLYLIGIFGVFDVPGQIYIGAVTTFRPFYLFGLEPLLWGLLGSTISGIVVSLLTKPLDEEIVSRMFDAEEPSGNP